ncbi:MAG: hypothetical protein AAGA56_13260 [Myxococcota bacterium]
MSRRSHRTPVPRRRRRMAYSTPQLAAVDPEGAYFDPVELIPADLLNWAAADNDVRASSRARRRRSTEIGPPRGLLERVADPARVTGGERSWTQPYLAREDAA